MVQKLSRGWARYSDALLSIPKRERDEILDGTIEAALASLSPSDRRRIEALASKLHSVVGHGIGSRMAKQVLCLIAMRIVAEEDASDGTHN